MSPVIGIGHGRAQAANRRSGTVTVTNSGRLLTAEELAERWQVKVGWVYAKTRSGEIPKVPLPGRYFRYRLDMIERFEAGELESNASKAT